MTDAVWFRYLEFFGSPNIAMLLAALFAIYTLAAQIIREKRPPEGDLMSTLSKEVEVSAKGVPLSKSMILMKCAIPRILT